MSTGRKDRNARITKSHSGSWGSFSQDYIRHATELFEHSASYMCSADENCSPYTLSALPMLFSALRALLIEANSGMYGLGRNNNALRRLGKEMNELDLLGEQYRLNETHRSRLELLYELRNEIIHPAHKPSGTPHGTPDYLHCLRELELLQSTGDDDSDYTWISQLQSHRLLRWAFSVIEDTAAIILKEHHASQENLALHIQSYRRYKAYDL